MGFIVRKRGFKEHAGPRAKAQATRFEATDELLAYTLGYGIKPSNYRRHFHRLSRPEAISNPIQLRSARYYKRKGKRMPFDPQADLPAMAGRQIDEINAFLHHQHIYPDRHYGFQRIFADGDQPSFDWNKGARFYSVGPHNYQNLSKVRRLRMRLNYEAVVEIDVRACYLTILHAMRGVYFDVNIDPYTLAGIDREPVKAFIAMTLGHDEFHKGWSKTAKDDYEINKKDKYEADGKTKKRYRNLEADHPFESVKKATLAALPVLADWPESPTTWSDLQYVESSAIGEALHTLNCIHGIPALPVHDSMIVPLSKRLLAEQVISNAFLKHAKVRPALSAKWLQNGCEVKEISRVYH